MDAVVITLIVLAGLTGLGATTFLGLRALYRSVRARAVRTVDHVRLRGLSHGYGPRAELARMRLGMSRAVDAAERTVAAGKAAGWSLGDSPALVRRLRSAALNLEVELRALESEPDDAVLRAGVAATRARVASVVEPAHALRTALVEHARRLGDADLADLARDCRIESQALRATP